MFIVWSKERVAGTTENSQIKVRGFSFEKFCICGGIQKCVRRHAVDEVYNREASFHPVFRR
jgi:hypothetical protein